jgi:hypothetical protein
MPNELLKPALFPFYTSGLAFVFPVMAVVARGSRHPLAVNYLCCAPGGPIAHLGVGDLSGEAKSTATQHSTAQQHLGKEDLDVALVRAQTNASNGG